MLLNDPRVSPEVADNNAIRNAANNGQIEVVKLLLTDPRVSPEAMNNNAILAAAAYGHLDVISTLLQDPRVQPHQNENIVIQNAALEGRIESIQLLLKDERVSSQANNKYLLHNAIESKSLELVKFLLQQPFTDQRIHNYSALRQAKAFGSEEIYNYLLEKAGPDFRPEISLKSLVEEGKTVHATWDLIPEVLARGDAFVVTEDGITDKEVAQVWAKRLGLGPPVSWETRDSGVFPVCYLKSRHSAELRGSKKIHCSQGTWPLIFALVCEKPQE